MSEDAHDLNGGGQLVQVRAARDSVILVMSPEDARWLRESLWDEEQACLEQIAAVRFVSAHDRLAVIRATLANIEEQLAEETR